MRADINRKRMPDYIALAVDNGRTPEGQRARLEELASRQPHFVEHSQPAADVSGSKSREKRGVIRRYLPWIAGATIAASGIIYNKEQQPSAKLGDRVEALQRATQVRVEQVVLRAGTTLRFTPVEVKLDSDGQGPSNVAETVPSGRELQVSEPLENSHNPGWIAFTTPDAKAVDINSLEDRARKTVWVHLDTVMDEGYAKVLPLQKDSIGEPLAYDAKILPSGDIEQVGETNRVVTPATSYLYPAGTFKPTPDTLPSR